MTRVQQTTTTAQASGMPFDLARAIEVLERTPGVFRAMLGGLSDAWTSPNEGPDTFSAFDNLGHLVHGERADWIPRARIILAREGRSFEPYDRFAQQRESAGRTVAELLDEFAALRADNLAVLRAWQLSDAQLDLTGTHPELGTVTLRQLLATWTAHDLGHIAQTARVLAKQYRSAVGPWQAYLPVLTRGGPGASRSLAPVTLEGVHVRLEPLSTGHVPALTDVGTDPDLWQWTLSTVRTGADMAAYVEEALTLQRQGTALPFATVERATGRVIGSTRFGNIDMAHRRVEIGWTWIAPPWQCSAINTEAKYLMLRYAFEELGCLRVELKTDARNERSRAAIRRIGAVEEGTLRSHMLADGGRVRDTVYYSIISSEWPDVKAALEARIQRA